MTALIDKMSLPEAIRKGNVWEIGGIKFNFVRALDRFGCHSYRAEPHVPTKYEKIARFPSGKKFWLIGLFLECAHTK